VTENTLTQRVKELRDALGDDAQEPAFIRTIPRVGYQFIAEVVEVGAQPAQVESVLPETTPAGYAPSGGDTVGPQPNGAAASRQRSRVALIAGVLFSTVIAGAVWFNAGDAVSPSSRGSRIMLAVLPFQNLTGDPGQDFLSDGLTEEMITELGRLGPRELGVIARTTSMAYKGATRTAQQVAAELKVDYVLEGSVRREADRVRVVAQLIRASDQTHLWAESYDRDVRGILAMQQDVARAIASATRLRLSAAVGAAGSRAHPDDAYEAYLRGRVLLSQRTRSAIEKAVVQFERAIGIDPAYAQAYAGLADAHELAATYAGAQPREALSRAMAAARRALELDPTLEEPHTSLGVICGSYLWKWDECLQHFEQALERNGSSALAQKGYGEVLSLLGRHDEALAAAGRAVSLDPLSPLMSANLGVTYHRARRYDDAARETRKALDLDPHYSLGHFNLGMILSAAGSLPEAAAALTRAREYGPANLDALAFLGHVYGRMGRSTEARAILDSLRATSEARYVSPYARALVHVGLGEREEALDQLEQAYEDRSWFTTLLKVDPAFDLLREEPRFEALLKRVGLSGTS
jgi:TolB-like protein